MYPTEEIIPPVGVKLAVSSRADYNPSTARTIFFALHRGVILRRSRRAAHDTRVITVRSILAAALVLCVLLSAVPLEVLSAGKGCPMPCCQGGGAMHGGCADGSCHVSFPEPSKPLRPVEPTKPAERVESDPMCGADGAPPPRGEAEAHARHAPAAPEPSHGDDGHDAVEHPSHRHAPEPHGATPQLTAATVSKPCAPDCGSPANSFSQLRRPGDAAALSFKLRPRPPSRGGRAREDAQRTSTSSAWRRPCRPRGPPVSSF